MATTKPKSPTTAKPPAKMRRAAPPPPPETDEQPASPAHLVTPEMRKKDLIDQVVETSGIKKKDAKPVVEATLAALGEAFGKGVPVNLQPLGKVRIAHLKDLPNGQALTLKLRRSAQAVAGARGLAGPEVDG